MSLVGQLHAETIGRPGLLGLNFKQEVNARSSRGVDDDISGSGR